MINKIRVVELFAGVGGFRLGLKDTNYKVVWSNQWEPSTKRQHASEVYVNRFGRENHSNKDISSVKAKDIPEHDLLVGGFPCQDYSVATSLKNSKGLEGKKGVLWWEIYRIINNSKTKPKYLFLENVDRLLKSPAKQRGRDFAIMLRSLEELGYSVEWRVINAADYGMPQRRKRVFILAYHNSTKIYDDLISELPKKWILQKGVFASSFPVSNASKLSELKLETDVLKISNNFNKNGKLSPFLSAGIFINGIAYSLKTEAVYKGGRTLLQDVLINDKEVSDDFFISSEDLDKWKYLKGAKKEIRKTKSGFEYNYSEGAMVFPDNLKNASRTIITAEGGKSPSRFKHVIKTKKGYRRLTPLELERLNMFPDNHTELKGITDVKRAFFMGNALVVGIIEVIGEELGKRINKG